MTRGEVGIRGVREVLAAVRFLAAADHQWAQCVGRRLELGGLGGRNGRVTPTGGHERGGEAKPDLWVAGLLGDLRLEGGDFSGRDWSGPWPACTGHNQTTQCWEKQPATSQGA